MCRHRSLFLLPLVPAAAARADLLSQRYDYRYQLYDEGDERIRIEAHYFRASLSLDNETDFRFQWLRDAISGASPTGALPGSTQPFLAELEDVRTGILGALTRKFGDHAVDLEISRSSEEDYLSIGLALKDTWELNDQNTTVTYGINYLDDRVDTLSLGTRSKHTYDLFAGVSQIIDKNTLVSANLTLGYAEGYLNDPYKAVQRTDIIFLPDGQGGTIEVPVDNLYLENRPDKRFRQVLQLNARHYVEAARGAVDATYRFSHDDFGITSNTLQLEWRQQIGEKLEVTPFVRYYRQNEADFFVRSLDGVPVEIPPSDPDGSGINYSADYRLSSFDAVSAGLRLRYKFSDTFSASAAWERYEMTGAGGTGETAPSAAYIDADLWTVGITAEF